MSETIDTSDRLLGEISVALVDDIASWRRVFGATAPENGRLQLRRAAGDLLRAIQINRTIDPDRAFVAKQVVVDALYEFAGRVGLGDDDAQVIILEAMDATEDGAAPLVDDKNLAPVLADDEEDDSRPPTFSDEALALRFAERHADLLRYIAPWGRWLFWDGTRWRFDETLAVFDLVRRLCRQTAAEAGEKSKIGNAIASAKTVAAVERLARSDRRFAATTEQWDADPWLLNTPSGTVDLRTGTIRHACPTEYITKITGVAPDHRCSIPVWSRFLDDVTGGDKDLQSFLKRSTGYALTGSTQEHALFFLYGTGANGKSTFLSAVIGCLGDFHRTAPIETFTSASTNRHPTELAALRGARLVTSIETEEGRQWAESRIKQLTGGDKIAARFMRQDFFEFLPAFKLFIAGNHKPGLRSVDEAIRRRMNLIPFSKTVPPEQRDKALPEKLRSEWPGILAWMIEGCLEWQRIGLAPPAAVQAATAEYLEAEDALAAWIQDSAEFDPNAFELTRALYQSWKVWADRAGEHVGSEKKFSERLAGRGESIGVRKDRSSHGNRGFYGLRLINAQAELQPTAAGQEMSDATF